MSRWLLLSLIACLLPACGDDGRVPIVVYSPHGVEILTRFEKLFEEAHPEVDVRPLNLPSAECLSRLRAEQQNPRCDVFWGATAPMHARAAGEGLLSPYRPAWIDSVDQRLRTGDDRFQSQFVMLQVILYNDAKMQAEQAPEGFSDLISGAFDGRVILRFPPPSGTMRGVFSWIIAWQAGLHGDDVEKGFDYLRRLHQATKRYAISPEELFEAIQKDDSLPVSLWSLTDAKFQKAQYGYPLGVKIPSEGVPVVLDCIALVKKKAGEDPRRADYARAFYDFVTSVDANLTLAEHHFRIPTRGDIPDARKPSWLRELTFEPLPADGSLADAHAAEWMTYWDENIKPLDR